MSPPPGGYPAGHPLFTATTAGGASVARETGHLERLLVELGNADGDLVFFLPFGEGTLGAGADVQDISSRGLHAVNTVERDLPPVIRGDLLSQRFNGADEDLRIADHDLLSAIDPADDHDTATSWGCAFMIKATGAVQVLMAKDDDAAREWRLQISAAGDVGVFIYDDDVPATRGRYYDTALLINTWYIIIATYDGRSGANAELGLTLYLWSGATHSWMGAVDDTTSSANVYVDMENLAELVMIGANNSPAHDDEFNGEQMMPWMTRRELSAEQARRAAKHMVNIMGL